MAITALSDEFTVSTSDETGCVEPSVAGHDDGSYLITRDGIHVFDFYSEAWGRTFDLLTRSSDEFLVIHFTDQPAREASDFVSFNKRPHRNPLSPRSSSGVRI